MEADPQIEDGELILRPLLGYAFQKDLTPMEYADAYLVNFCEYDDAVRAKLLAGRFALVERHLQAGGTLLDYGSGSGAFVRYVINCGQVAKGYEVIPAARAVLERKGLYSDAVESFDAVTAWDVIEHLRSPRDFLRRVRGLLFASVPIFADLTKIRESKHYKPGEHLFHFTDAGFVAAVEEQGFELLERSSHETDAGRDSIGAYAFRRVR